MIQYLHKGLSLASIFCKIIVCIGFIGRHVYIDICSWVHYYLQWYLNFLFHFGLLLLLLLLVFSQNNTPRKIHESFPGKALTFSKLISACLRISIYSCSGMCSINSYGIFSREFARSFCLCMSNTYIPIIYPVDVVSGSAKGADIVLEAVVEAEVARNAKDFFSQPQNQIQWIDR